MNFHHIAISVSNLNASRDFYEKLGFKEVHRWDADDQKLTILHLKLRDAVLELFAFASNKDVDQLDLKVANDLEQIGVKHIGLNVPDVTTTFMNMKKAGYHIGNDEVQHGKTKIDYFFIKDPDGMWVEIVEDNRGY